MCFDLIVHVMHHWAADRLLHWLVKANKSVSSCMTTDIQLQQVTTFKSVKYIVGTAPAVIRLPS